MKFTPMMEQYLTIKKTLPHNTLLFFRLGDFYEMFFEDAALASRVLNIALTGREGGAAGRVPMCGVPHHSSKSYVLKLIEAGHKVAICEQMEDPRFAKGIVERKVTRIISQSTYVEDADGAADENRYLAACNPGVGGRFGLAYVDLGTGEFKAAEVPSLTDLKNELARIRPREALLPETGTPDSELARFFQSECYAPVNYYDSSAFDDQRAEDKIKSVFRLASIAGLGLSECRLAAGAAGAILEYLEDHRHTHLEHLKHPRIYAAREYLVLDPMTSRNLEIIQPLSGDKQAPTLLSTLDETLTPMGGRALRFWLARPLFDREKIMERLAAVRELVLNASMRSALREALGSIRDIERLAARLNCDLGSARDLAALRDSLARVPAVRAALDGMRSPLLTHLSARLFEMKDWVSALSKAIVEAPPMTVKEGGFIRPGFDTELDELRNLSLHGRDYLARLQQREVERTGIKSLKVRYNQVFGYYIEVSKANLDAVPQGYIRRQTLVNAERFIIPELKEYEDKILSAVERANQREYEFFEMFRNQVREALGPLQTTAESLGILDVSAGFAEVAVRRDYCEPEMVDEPLLSIEGGRHPVVELVLPKGEFVENDVLLNSGEDQLLLITGPNMAGKSTFIRTVGLITLMAHIGSFVPARKAVVGLVDRIFTRIGAQDHLARGESTFMVEMIETANILNNATPRSLIIMDEIGRGTSTYDGVSIAWSVSEFLARPDGPKPRSLFATHYHELHALEGLAPGAKNYNVTVQETQGSIVFLRKIVRGVTDKSYGIHVAKLAGVPEAVIARAREILHELEHEETERGARLKQPLLNV